MQSENDYSKNFAFKYILPECNYNRLNTNKNIKILISVGHRVQF